MAKLSVIERELKREKLVKRYAQKRADLKEVIRNPKSSDEERWEAQVQLQKMPVNSSEVRRRRRCALTGRSRGVYRKFGLARNMLRKFTMDGFVPGLRKASW